MSPAYDPERNSDSPSPSVPRNWEFQHKSLKDGPSRRDPSLETEVRKLLARASAGTVVVIGRSKSLPDAQNFYDPENHIVAAHETISRHHCEIEKVGPNEFLVSNGILHPIGSIDPGDTLQVTPSLRITIPDPASTEEAMLREPIKELLAGKRDQIIIGRSTTADLKVDLADAAAVQAVLERGEDNSIAAWVRRPAHNGITANYLGNEFEVHGSLQAGAGCLISLTPGVEFRLPFEDSLEPLVRQTPYTMYPDTAGPEILEVDLRAAFDFVNEALENLKLSKDLETSTHFISPRAVEIAANAGIPARRPRHIHVDFRNEVSVRAALENAEVYAAFEPLANGSELFGTIGLYTFESGHNGNMFDQELVRRLYNEAATISAISWLSGISYASGVDLSTHGCFLDGPTAREQDALLYLMEKGVPLSDRLLAAYDYPTARKNTQPLYSDGDCGPAGTGFATFNLVQESPENQPLVLGRENLTSPSAIETVSRMHATIEKLSGPLGPLYRVTDGAGEDQSGSWRPSKNHTYYRVGNHWKELVSTPEQPQSVVLKPGTSVRLGPDYEFQLP